MKSLTETFTADRSVELPDDSELDIDESVINKKNILKFSPNITTDIL
jgi:hypothetical protein